MVAPGPAIARRKAAALSDRPDRLHCRPRARRRLSRRRCTKLQPDAMRQSAQRCAAWRRLLFRRVSEPQSLAGSQWIEPATAQRQHCVGRQADSAWGRCASRHRKPITERQPHQVDLAVASTSRPRALAQRSVRELWSRQIHQHAAGAAQLGFRPLGYSQSSAPRPADHGIRRN